MKRFTLALFLFQIAATLLHAQNQNTNTDFFRNKDKYRVIKQSAPRELPADLKSETILFLKFDSVPLPAQRPKDFDKVLYIKWRNHNEAVPEYNKLLRKYAEKYPFKYKIVSMTDTTSYRTSGVKYLFWMNSFDAFVADHYYSRGGKWHGFGSNATYVATNSEGTALGIVDLTANKTYLISRLIGVSATCKYDVMIRMLNNEISRQFKK